MIAETPQDRHSNSTHSDTGIPHGRADITRQLPILVNAFVDFTYGMQAYHVLQTRPCHLSERKMPPPTTRTSPPFPGVWISSMKWWSMDIYNASHARVKILVINRTYSNNTTKNTKTIEPPPARSLSRPVAVRSRPARKAITCQ